MCAVNIKALLYYVLNSSCDTDMLRNTHACAQKQNTSNFIVDPFFFFLNLIHEPKV